MKQILTKSQYWALRDYRDIRRAQSRDTSMPINDRESCQREATLASARIARADKVLFPPAAVITIECDGGVIDRDEVENRLNIEPVLSIMKTCAKNFSKTEDFNGVMGHISRKAWLEWQENRLHFKIRGSVRVCLNGAVVYTYQIPKEITND